ncbi:ABC transporter ATP-binding protein [uncultured Roseobacter sp.]|uniref:ABC transporter ATP-binding protein n=1 Tax=uncultured Roseobacter sp. TaxID=114847 RepID=UPI0026135C37|nr:ABC transporter ATP-binding protein [uncultured Roseobacter sp.]
MSLAIQLRKLSKSFGEIDALKDIDLDIQEGEFIALVGPSGCGKTTLLRHVLSLETASSGEILVGGDTPERVRRENKLGIVFQRAALVPSCTSLQNVQMTIDITGVETPLTPSGLLDEFGLGAFKDHYPHQLSGGMQQRVNIAAAMVHNPPFLMMDEPFGALDEMTREFMCEFLGEVLLDNPKTTVLVTHSIDEAVMLADRIVILAPRPGRISAIVDVDFPRPRRRDLKTQTAFGEKVLEVRRLLYEVEES